MNPVELRKAAKRLLDEGMGAIDRPVWVAYAVMDLARSYLGQELSGPTEHEQSELSKLRSRVQELEVKLERWKNDDLARWAMQELADRAERAEADVDSRNQFIGRIGVALGIPKRDLIEEINDWKQRLERAEADARRALQLLRGVYDQSYDEVAPDSNLLAAIKEFIDGNPPPAQAASGEGS